MPKSSEKCMADALEMVGKTSPFLPAKAVTVPTEHEPATTGRRSRPWPQSGTEQGTSVQPYKSPTYETEKRQGIRRGNGAKKLKKLSNRHLQILSRHLQGESGEMISDCMGITVITVSRILNDPLCKSLLSRIYEDRQNELDALAGDAIDVVRQGLQGDHTIRERLTAVDKFTKLKDSIGSEEASGKTAEDIVSEIFNRVTFKDSTVQINIGKGNG